jgi:hypothetical protein
MSFGQNSFKLWRPLGYKDNSLFAMLSNELLQPHLRRSFSEEVTSGASSPSSESSGDSESTAVAHDFSPQNPRSSPDSVGNDCPVDGVTCCSDLSPATKQKTKKKLSFDQLVRCVLIPTVDEYKEAGIHIFLWCTKYELQCYKDSAYNDIKDFMWANNCRDFTEAMKALFQIYNTPDDVEPALPVPPRPAARLRAEAPSLCSTYEDGQHLPAPGLAV